MGKEVLIKEAQSGQETEEEQKINHCNYIQEHRGSLGRYKEQKTLQLYKLSACTDESSDYECSIHASVGDSNFSAL